MSWYRALLDQIALKKSFEKNSFDKIQTNSVKKISDDLVDQDRFIREE